jgi:hypothetical protein
MIDLHGALYAILLLLLAGVLILLVLLALDAAGISPPTRPRKLPPLPAGPCGGCGATGRQHLAWENHRTGGAGVTTRVCVLCHGSGHLTHPTPWP